MEAIRDLLKNSEAGSFRKAVPPGLGLTGDHSATINVPIDHLGDHGESGRGCQGYTMIIDDIRTLLAILTSMTHT